MTEEPERLADLHSHLVPGVDDGAKTIDDVVEGVDRMRARGVVTIATTPHLEGSLTLDPEGLARRMDEMDAAFEPARRAVAERFPELSFSRANEVALDHPEPDLSERRLRLGGGPFVLVEWARLHVPPGSRGALERLRAQGVEPLLAHPERYPSMGSFLQSAEEWKAAGAAFQVNYGSISGAYGPDAQQRALHLLARGWVDCLATDFHGRPSLRMFITPSRERFASAESETGTEDQAWKLLTWTNPSRILRGEAPLPVPPLEREETLWHRVVSLFR